MGSKNDSMISRREFARRAAFASAAASLSPAELMTTASASSVAPPYPQTASTPKLSPESQAEVDSRLQAVFAQYGARLSDAQKADLRRLAAEGQAGLDRLRAYPTDNADGPALYLKPLIEHERKPSPMPVAAESAGAPKNS